MHTFNPLMITYENLKFSGDLKLFDDIKLRNSISYVYETFDHIKDVELRDMDAVSVYYENYLMQNARLINMSMSSSNFGKDGYFENTVHIRMFLSTEIRDAYIRSIKAIKKLKIKLEKSEK
jgi:hypothetical protein